MMTTWIAGYLAKNPDMAAFRVSGRALNATHFELAPRLRRAVITGGPQNVRTPQGWQPLDVHLQPDGAGSFGATGLPAQIGLDGSVRFAGQRYAHRTVSVGVLRGGHYQRLAEFGDGLLAGDRLVREAGPFLHQVRVTPRGIKEELVVRELPRGLDVGTLVYETELDVVVPPQPAGNGAFSSGALQLPPGAARDAAGTPLSFERVLVQDRGWRLYSGVPLAALEDAVFPVVIDPTVSLGSASDGLVWGLNAAYATARATSTSFDASFTSMDVGQTLSGSTYYVYRSFLKFSLASIPGSVQLISARLGLACVNDLSTTADFDVQIVKQDWSAQDPLASGTREAAYDNCVAGNMDVVWRNTNGISTGVQYQSPPLDLAWLSPGANAYYSLRSSRDKNSNVPSSGTERIELATSEHATPAYRPLLIIDYYTVASAAGRLAQPLPAVGIHDTRVKLRARKRRTLAATRSKRG